MRKNILFTGLLFLIGAGFFASTTTTATDNDATAIEGLKLTMTGEYLNIQWDDLDGTKKSSLDGYGVNWGESALSVRNDKVARQHLNFPTSMEVWAKVTFDRDRYYYLRVLGYKKRDDRGYDNLFGSKIIKWKYDFNGTIESSIIEPSDVTLSSPTSSTTTSEDDIFDFGILRATAFDTIVRFSWSRPALTTNEYDDFVIVISEKSDLSDPVLEGEIGKKIYKARIDGLKPATTYFAAGYFVKDGKRFGKSKVITIKTAPLLDQRGKERLHRRLKTIGRSEGFGTIIDAEEYEDDTVSTSTTSTTTSSTNTTKTTTATRTTRTNFEIPETAKEINAELRKIRAEIGGLKRHQLKMILRLRELQNQE